MGIGLTYLVGAGQIGGGPFDFCLEEQTEKKMPGNAEKYSLENIEALENSPFEGEALSATLDHHL